MTIRSFIACDKKISSGQPVIVSWIAITIFATIALLPIIMMLGKSFVIDGRLSLHAYAVLLETRVFNLLWKSLAMAGGATLLSIFFGIPFAVLIARTEFFGQKICSLLYLVPLFIPPHIHALAWIYLLGDRGIVYKLIGGAAPLFNLYSPVGAAIILFLSYCPIVVLLAYVGLIGLDKSLEESATFSQPGLTVLRKITIPLLKPYIISGAVFVFIFSFFNYGVPSMLRVPSFPVEIFSRFSAFYDESGAVALSLPLITLALLLLIIQGIYMENRSCATIRPVNYIRTPHPLYGQTWLSPLYIYASLAVVVFLPLIALTIQAGGVKSYQLAFQTSSREIGVTVILAAVSATSVTILAYFLCVYTTSRASVLSRILGYCTFLPFAFPAALFGIGLIRLWNTPTTQFIYSTCCILVIAYIARFIPFGIRIIDARLKQINPSLHEAALFCERSWLRRLWYVHLPLARQGLIACWMIIFIFCAGELGATLLLIPPGWGTVTLKVYTLMHYGAGPLVAALALILISLNLMVASCLFVTTSR